MSEHEQTYLVPRANQAAWRISCAPPRTPRPVLQIHKKRPPSLGGWPIPRKSSDASGRAQLQPPRTHVEIELHAS
eukprot:4679468-Alexandrium_andersonii.AAC.1